MPVLPHKLYSHPIGLVFLTVCFTLAYHLFSFSSPSATTTTTPAIPHITYSSFPFFTSRKTHFSTPAMTTAAAIVVPAATKHTATFIFLHGLGDTGAGWSFISENFRLRRKFDECTFIFPHAPMAPVDLNMGMRMPSWFNLYTLSEMDTREDENGMLSSVEKVHGIIQEQIAKGIASERIVLGGFSQGGAVALLSGLTCKYKLGGIAALSTWLPLSKKIASMTQDANKETSIFQAHGEKDTVVKFKWGEDTKATLQRWHQPVEWHSYPDLGHSADPQEIMDMERWMLEIIADQA